MHLSISNYEIDLEVSYCDQKIISRPKKKEKRRPSITMLSITECKKKLNKKGIHFTDEEIELIRNVLYKVAEVCHKEINKKQNDK